MKTDKRKKRRMHRDTAKNLLSNGGYSMVLVHQVLHFGVLHNGI